MKFRYDESFLFPQGLEDYGRGLMFPQGQLHGSFEKTVYTNRFLFPPGGSDTDHGETLMFPQGQLHGFGVADVVSDVQAKVAALRAAQAAQAVDTSAFPLSDALAQVENYARAVSGAFRDVQSLSQSLMQQNDTVGARALLNVGGDSVAKANQALANAKSAAAAGDLATVQQLVQVAADLMTEIRRQVQVADGQVAATAAEAERSRQAAAAVAAADAAEIARLNKSAVETAAAQQAAAQQAAAAEAARQAAANEAAQKAARAEWDAAHPQIAAQMQAERDAEAARLAKIAAAAAAATVTQKAAVDTSTATVQHTDTASGTTSTVNAATGAVKVTTPGGATVTGAGMVNAGGVITTVDTKTGTVTTQNTQTGVVTQTDASTGKTVTAVQVTGTAGTGGTFMMPDGKTVTTTQSITATPLSPGHIALAALVGILLLRGAVR